MVATTTRILVIEDDIGIREHLGDRLKHYDLTFATCQSEAYERLKSDEFDLILLDLRLPRNPQDMRATNEVGIAILVEIRKRCLVKHGSGMMMPVVVMTAYGSEKLSAQILIDNGANDYIPKPFGLGQELEHKIERALKGEGALVPAANIVGTVVRMAFHPNNSVVRIETLSYRGAHHELLRILADLYIADLHALRSFENFTRIPGKVFADKLNITDDNLRARLRKFRKAVKQDFRERLGRAIGKNDIVENPRDWKGYRLNPRVVRVLAWDQIPDSEK